MKLLSVHVIHTDFVQNGAANVACAICAIHVSATHGTGGARWSRFPQRGNTIGGVC